MEEIVEMILVLIVVEMAALFANLVALAIAQWFENKSWLEEDLASVLIDLLEPVPQFLVPVRVIVQYIDRVLGVAHTFSVGEPLEKRPQLPGGLTKCGVLYIMWLMVMGRVQWMVHPPWQRPCLQIERSSRPVCH